VYFPLRRSERIRFQLKIEKELFFNAPRQFHDTFLILFFCVRCIVVIIIFYYYYLLIRISQFFNIILKSHTAYVCHDACVCVREWTNKIKLMMIYIDKTMFARRRDLLLLSLRKFAWVATLRQMIDNRRPTLLLCVY